MTPSDRKQIEAWIVSRAVEFDLELIFDSSEQARPLAQFCDALTDMGPGIKIKKRSPDSDAELPAILVGSRLKYQAVPLGPELGPFLGALENHLDSPGTGAAGIPDLDALDVPAHLQVYIAPQCPQCPQTVQMLLPLVQANDNISISVIDGTLFKNMADKAVIKSAPADRDHRQSGPGQAGSPNPAQLYRRRPGLRPGADDNRCGNDVSGPYRAAHPRPVVHPSGCDGDG